MEIHEWLVPEPRYILPPKPSLAERILNVVVALLMVCAIVLGILAATTSFAHASESTFAWAAQKECKCSAFAWAAQGCKCGAGCPCCHKDGGCQCDNKGDCMNEDQKYNRLRAQAIRENRVLIVAVGCYNTQPFTIEGTLFCHVESIQGVKAPAVCVCRMVNGVFARVATLKSPCTEADVRKALRVPAPAAPASFYQPDPAAFCIGGS